MELNTICSYRNERIPFDTIAKEDYVSTENLLPDKGGLKLTSSFPENGNVCAFYKGDVLISNIRPYFKKIWLADKDGGCSADVLVFKAKENINNKFLFYILSQDSFFDFVMQGAKGCKMPRGDKNFTMTFDVSKLPLKKQNEIASVLSSLDAKIETNNRLSEDLEELAQAIFKSWFVDFEPFKNGNFVESELGMIPEGWEVGKIGDLCTFKRGKGLLSKDAILGDVPVVAGGMQPSCYHNVANTQAPVVTVSGSGANAGFTRLYHVNVWASDCSFIDRNCENLYFVYCYLIRNKRLLKHAQTGAVQPHVKPADIHNFETVIPPKDILVQFNSIIEELLSQNGIFEKENQRLANLRDTILPRLMSGEIKL